jgi:hypothetical protein
MVPWVLDRLVDELRFLEDAAAILIARPADSPQFALETGVSFGPCDRNRHRGRGPLFVWELSGTD